MATFDLARLIDDWAAGWSSQDVDKVVALFTDDGVYEDVQLGVVNHGKAEIKAFLNAMFNAFPDSKLELHRRFSYGTPASAEWTWSGTQTGDLSGIPATNKSASVRGTSVFELQGDKIRRCSDYWDMATFLRQIGLMPSEQQ